MLHTQTWGSAHMLKTISCDRPGRKFLASDLTVQQFSPALGSGNVAQKKKAYIILFLRMLL